MLISTSSSLRSVRIGLAYIFGGPDSLRVLLFSGFILDIDTRPKRDRGNSAEEEGEKQEEKRIKMEESEEDKDGESKRCAQITLIDIKIKKKNE